ncbi:MAG: sensor histidine kinase [Planctomycetota bacterium]|jgi:two-component system NtrC family sensor kinase
MMRRIGIRARVLLVFSVANVAIGIVVGALMLRAAMASVDRELESVGNTLACSVAESSTDMVLTDSRFDLLNLLTKHCGGREGVVSYIFVLDRAGQVLAHTFSEGFPLELLAVDQHEGRSVLLETEGDVIHDFAAPILEGRAGTVRLGLSEARVVAEAKGMLSNALLLGAIAYAVGAVGVGVIVTLVTRPLRQLAQVAERVSQGLVHPEIDSRVGGDIGKLAASFKHMLASLETRTRALAAAERMAAVGELAAGVAHEINNPLDGVQNCLRQHGRLQASSRHCQEFVALIGEGLARIETVVRQLLTFAKDEKPRRSKVDVDSVVRNSLIFVEHRASNRKCRLSFEPNGGLPKVWADERGLQQVVVNLAMNAIDSVEEGGEVRIRTRRVDRGVAVEVADTGTGIAEETRSRMFEPFFTTKEVGKGTGLGLPVSKNIVDAHGGTVEFETVIGKGSVFLVTLPIGDGQHGTPD